MDFHSNLKLQLFFICLTSILFRTCVSLWGYSGEYKPPMFGDFEAQRHWMEITVNLPTKDWYINTQNNDLQYWGLDYPPLTAYHMMVNGKIARYVNSSMVELHQSRGFESSQMKFFMRASVILMDALVFLPSVVAFFICQKMGKDREGPNSMKNILVLALYPGLMLVDNGHFQYNSVSLGLMVLAACCLGLDFDLLGAILFCFALNYKQMELYHALPFFGYLLGKCLKQPGAGQGILKCFTLGVTVIITFILIWTPFLINLESTKAVLLRLFPIKRGLYEDKVANVWCALSIIIKLKHLLSQEKLAILCLITTTILLLPSFLHLIRNPNPKAFQYSLINSSLVFFLFSFHVHEKTILLAAIPAALVVEKDPFAVIWFLLISIFSMLPLLVKDTLLIPTIATTALFHIIVNAFLQPSIRVRNAVKIMYQMSIFGCFVLSLAHIMIAPPKRYPDLLTLLIAIYSCAHFILFGLYFHIAQIYSTSIFIESSKQKVG